MTSQPEKILKNIGIFKECDDRCLSLLFKKMTRLEVKKEEMIFEAGDSGEEMFVIVKGSVSIFIHDEFGEEIILTNLEDGTCFGEMSIIEQDTRSASCRALEDTELLALHAEDYAELIFTMPQDATGIMNRMLKTLVERLQRTGAFVTQLAQYGEESRKRAITDPATGLFNRRYLEESLEGLVTKAVIDNTSLSLAMFDLDRFGTLNREYGQQFCDDLIVKCSGVFRETFEKTDILVRYGGDEFIFIFPDTEFEEAGKKCRSLCEAIRSMSFPEHSELRLTCSLGYSSFPETAANMGELKEKSDRALYEAKEAGRDRAIGA